MSKSYLGTFKNDESLYKDLNSHGFKWDGGY